ncbi:hypothetical protein Q5H92_21825 [Hymenobacter sp. M29]|uniref:Uncharacterized protein n=1 Tax=Hymenobacter mellowenesis TaxID=3063995 RepID=A0ABT9AI58_9BACT|nr:hypothetical protein [Hymenobacter sp. M29]MDO7849019.1 hypothetical protein [Hymenobacter sp. M29]
MYTPETAAQTAQQAAAQVNALRALILDLLFASPVITAQEWATAVERTSNTLSVATLAKWYRNTVAEIARREAQAQPVTYATNEQKEQIIRLLNHPAVTRPKKTKILLRINRYEATAAEQLIADLTALTTAPAPKGGGGARVGASGELVGFTLAA